MMTWPFSWLASEARMKGWTTPAPRWTAAWPGRARRAALNGPSPSAADESELLSQCFFGPGRHVTPVGWKTLPGGKSTLGSPDLYREEVSG